MHISYKDVEQQCNSLHELAKSMDETITQINTLNASVKGVWLGPAADAFTGNLGAAAASFAEVRAAIETSILYMAKCAEGYKAIDKTVMQEICDYLNISIPTNPRRRSGGGSGGGSGAKLEDSSMLLEEGKKVLLTEGEYANNIGTITDIDEENNKITVSIEVNGEEKEIEIDLNKSGNDDEV